MENQPYDEINSNGHNLDEVERFIRMMHPDGERFEVRYIKDKYACPKVFEDPKEAAAYIGQIKDATGVYITLNPVVENISGSGAKDEEIVRRRWLLIDCDYKRDEACTNATQKELDAALQVRGQVEAYLAEQGFPEPVKLMSGNGGHLLFRIDLEPESDLVRRVLVTLNKKYGKGKVEIDCRVANASRITKVAGTLTKKGENTEERPCRRARLENPDIKPEVVPEELLEKVASEVPEKRPKAATRAANGHGSERNVPLPVIEPIKEQCAFIRHCQEDAPILSELEWFAMMSILSLCLDGERLAHEWSSLYHEYNYIETQRKYERAVENNMPQTCERIRDELGFAGCRGCRYEDNIHSPIALGRHELRSRFYVRDGGIWLNGGEGKNDVQLTNFTAVISRNLRFDDDTEVQHRYEIKAIVGDTEHVIQVPAEKFEKLGWVAGQLGAKAVLADGNSNKEKARLAIQAMGLESCTNETFYSHTGWRNTEHGYVFLHSGGAIAANGQVEQLDIQLHGSMNKYQLELPVDEESERRAIRASLGMLDLGPTTICYPLLAGVYRSALGKVGLCLHLVGGTGVFKTQLAALAQQHYGAEFSGECLPGSWTSTVNAIEQETFLAKDTLFVIDDFKPVGTRYDVDRLHAFADRLIRSAVDGHYRARLNQNSELKPEKPPRTMLLSTGEDTPRGESLRARMLIIKFAKGDIDKAVLTRCQQEAADGLYVQAMTGCIRWVAGQYEAIQARLKARQLELRDQLQVGRHQRTASNIARLIAGWELLLEYAAEKGALTQAEADQHREQCMQALLQLADDQDQQQEQYSIEYRFCELLRSAISSGQAHLKNRHGGAPEEPLSWGWYEDVNTTQGTLRTCSSCVGWLDRGNLYLDLEPSISVVRKVAADTEGIGFTADRITGALYEAGLLASTDIKTKRRTHLVRRVVSGRRTQVLHLNADALGVVPGAIRVTRPPEEGDQPVIGRITPREQGA